MTLVNHKIEYFRDMISTLDFSKLSRPTLQLIHGATFGITNDRPTSHLVAILEKRRGDVKFPTYQSPKDTEAFAATVRYEIERADFEKKMREKEPIRGTKEF